MPIFRLAQIILLLVASFTVSAAEIRAVDDDSVISVVIEGVIEKGDYEKLVNMLERIGPMPPIIQLYSPGGDAQEAMKIGRLIRQLFMTTSGPYSIGTPEGHKDYHNIVTEDCGDLYPDLDREFIIQPEKSENCICASACYLIWVAGVKRDNGMLRIHRPKFDSQFFASLDAATAERLYGQMLDAVREYMKGYGVSEETIALMVDTPSYELEHHISNLHGYIPYLDELLASKCGAFTKDDWRQYNLTHKVREGRATEEEKKLGEKAAAKRYKIVQCQMWNVLHLRIKAFSEFFKRDYVSELRSGSLK